MTRRPTPFLRTTAALAALTLTLTLTACGVKQAPADPADVTVTASPDTTVGIPEWTYAHNQNVTCETTRFRMVGDTLQWEELSRASADDEGIWLSTEIPLTLWNGRDSFIGRSTSQAIHAFCLDDEHKTLFLAFDRNIAYEEGFGVEYFFCLSKDGGRTWQCCNAPTASDSKDGLAALDINADGVGCAVIWDYSDSTYTIYLTRDFAQTWEELPQPPIPEEYSVLEGHYNANVHVMEDNTIRLDFRVYVGYAHMNTYVFDTWTYEKRDGETDFRLITELPPPAVADGK